VCGSERAWAHVVSDISTRVTVCQGALLRAAYRKEAPLLRSGGGSLIRLFTD